LDLQPHLIPSSHHPKIEGAKTSVLRKWEGPGPPGEPPPPEIMKVKFHVKIRKLPPLDFTLAPRCPPSEKFLATPLAATVFNKCVKWYNTLIFPLWPQVAHGVAGLPNSPHEIHTHIFLMSIIPSLHIPIHLLFMHLS